jgi:hypothetical protein
MSMRTLSQIAAVTTMNLRTRPVARAPRWSRWWASPASSPCCSACSPSARASARRS